MSYYIFLYSSPYLIKPLDYKICVALSVEVPAYYYYCCSVIEILDLLISVTGS